MSNQKYMLVSTMLGDKMTKSYPTEQAAMKAAVDFVQGFSGTIYRGSLFGRWEMARDWWTWQGGEMEIICRDGLTRV